MKKKKLLTKIQKIEERLLRIDALVEDIHDILNELITEDSSEPKPSVDTNGLEQENNDK